MIFSRSKRVHGNNTHLHTTSVYTQNFKFVGGMVCEFRVSKEEHDIYVFLYFLS